MSRNGTSSTRRGLMCSTAGSLIALAADCSSHRLRIPRGGRSTVFVLLRGGADGLSMVVPYSDPEYYRARPRTAIAPPGVGPNRALDLDGRFGLHPQLAPLLPIFQAKELAVVVATGNSDSAPRHIEAERQLTSLLSESVGSRLLRVPGFSLGEQLSHVADEIVRHGERGAAFMVESEGWDTHVAQGLGHSGRLAERLAELARELGQFRRRLGGRFRQVDTLVLSEFGRSVRETPMGGTADGGASALLALGDFEQAGRVTGRWPPLASASPTEVGRLPVATELSSLLVELGVRRKVDRT